MPRAPSAPRARSAAHVGWSFPPAICLLYWEGREGPQEGAGCLGPRRDAWYLAGDEGVLVKGEMRGWPQGSGASAQGWAGPQRAALHTAPFQKLTTAAENNTLSTNGATVISHAEAETPGPNTI